MFPHAPQCAGLRVVSTHAFPQHASAPRAEHEFPQSAQLVIVPRLVSHWLVEDRSQLAVFRAHVLAVVADELEQYWVLSSWRVADVHVQAVQAPAPLQYFVHVELYVVIVLVGSAHPLVEQLVVPHDRLVGHPESGRSMTEVWVEQAPRVPAWPSQ